MSRGFSNSTVGGIGNLIRSWIQSVPFVSGSVGWRISKNGNAEFNNVTIRGIVIISSASGLFAYNGTPALGNLVLSIASAAGNDLFGNAYPIGLSFSNGSQSILTSVVAFGGSNAPTTRWKTGQSTEGGAGRIGAGFTGAAPTTARYLYQIIGPNNSAQTDFALLDFESSSDGATSTLATALGRLRYQNSLAASYDAISFDYKGAVVLGQITAADPTTGLSQTNIASPETWHRAILTGTWTGSGNGINGLAYRKTAENELEIVADLTVPAAPGTIFTFAAAYIPGIAGQNIPCGSYAANTNPHCSISAGGALTAAALGAAGTALVIQARVPLAVF